MSFHFVCSDRSFRITDTFSGAYPTRLAAYDRALKLTRSHARVEVWCAGERVYLLHGGDEGEARA
ncbi:MAG TPA: hypothetical protein VD929_08715 [Caulobacteraceae bacterium]|nr:hypothetical protein [Caulobacteraceae bacterium]